MCLTVQDCVPTYFKLTHVAFTSYQRSYHEALDTSPHFHVKCETWNPCHEPWYFWIFGRISTKLQTIICGCELAVFDFVASFDLSILHICHAWWYLAMHAMPHPCLACVKSFRKLKGWELQTEQTVPNWKDLDYAFYFNFTNSFPRYHF